MRKLCIRFARFFASMSWMFPLSGAKHRRDFVYFGFGVPFGLFMLGVEMTGNYAVVQYAFWGTWLTSSVLVYLSLNIITPFSRKFWTGVAAVILGAGLLGLYDYLCPSVTLNPSQVKFSPPERGSGAISQGYRFRIQNRTDDDLYGVSFLVKVHSAAIDFAHLRFEVPTSSRIPFDEGTSIGRKFADIEGMECKDEKGYPVFMLSIAHLDPHGSREFVLTLLNDAAESLAPSSTLPSKLDIPGKGTILTTAQISGLTHNSQVLTRPGLATSTMRVPEKLKCDALAVVGN